MILYYKTWGPGFSETNKTVSNLPILSKLSHDNIIIWALNVKCPTFIEGLTNSINWDEYAEREPCHEPNEGYAS